MPAAPRYVLPEGTEIGGYEITGFVGAGGFGIVYEARNPVTGERVAIKEYFPRSMVSRRDDNVILHNDNQQGMHRSVLNRFEFTTGLQFGFDHKNILKVKNYVRRNNTGFMIAEFVDGRSLPEHLERFGGVFPSYAASRTLMEQIVGAVGYVHRKHHLHRDISPENVLVDNFGKPVLIDFGSLKRNIDARELSSIIAYRDEYSPPEQRVRTGLERFYTDIYALAGTMYFSLAGRPPPSSESRGGAIANNQRDPFLSLEQRSRVACPPEAYRAIDRALRLPVAARQQTIEEFAAELGWQPDFGGARQHSDVSKLTTLGTIAVDEEPTIAADPKRVVPPSDPPPTPSRTPQPRSYLGVYAVAVTTVLLVAAGWQMRNIGQPSPAPTPLPGPAPDIAPRPNPAPPPVIPERAPPPPSSTPATPPPRQPDRTSEPVEQQPPRNLPPRAEPIPDPPAVLPPPSIPRRLSRTASLCGRPTDYVVDASTGNRKGDEFLGAWTGTWNNASRICGALIVSKVDPDGRADIVYIFGPGSRGGIAWKSQKPSAVVTNGTLSFRDDDGASFGFSLAPGRLPGGKFPGRTRKIERQLRPDKLRRD